MVTNVFLEISYILFKDSFVASTKFSFCLFFLNTIPICPFLLLDRSKGIKFIIKFLSSDSIVSILKNLESDDAIKILENIDEKDKNTRASDEYIRFMMENSALRAEMKRKDGENKRKDEEIKGLKALLQNYLVEFQKLHHPI